MRGTNDEGLNRIIKKYESALAKLEKEKKLLKNKIIKL